jgi:hypothetical protein
MKEIKKTITRVERKPVDEIVEVVEEPVIEQKTTVRRGPVLVANGPTLAEAVGAPRVVETVEKPQRVVEKRTVRRKLA